MSSLEEKYINTVSHNKTMFGYTIPQFGKGAEEK